MNDFVSSFWSYWIATLALGGVVFCLILLFSQRVWLKREIDQVEDTGHVWDGDLTELNNPIPRWWTIMFILLCVVALGMFVLYPALGFGPGVTGYSSAREVRANQIELQERIAPIYARYAEMSFEDVAKDAEAREIGQRLFLNNCAQCHGSDARGAASFPNLADNDWIWGGEPEQIIHTITEGRHGMMPPWGSQLSPSEASDTAQYVRSLSGLAHDPMRIVAGKRHFDAFCVACHGADGTGNTALGAPNLTDNIWLHGSSEASIVQTILNGRENIMPPQKNLMTEDQIRLLAAWVWGLSNNDGNVVAAAN